MGIDYYYFAGSPPCAALELAAKTIGVTFNPIEKDYFAQDQLKPEFAKLNPQKTCPFINDDGFILSESRPIIIYLHERYGKDESLYPRDPQTRAVINHRMYFETATLYQRFYDHLECIFGDKPEIRDSERKKLSDAVDIVEQYLTNTKWIAGDTVTLADFSFVATLDLMQACGYDFSSRNKITSYINTAKATLKDYSNTAGKHVEELSAYINEEAKKKGLKF